MSKVLVSETNLIAIGDAIRNKKKSSDKYKPGEMAEAISSITTGGGGGDIEIPPLTGTQQYRFSYNGFNWFIEQFGDKITTENLGTTQYMFEDCTELENIPFEFNYNKNSSVSLPNMFRNCRLITQVPKMNNCKPSSLQNIFSGCYCLRNLPDDIEEWFDWSVIENGTSGYSNTMGNSIFQYCYSLRSIPMGFLSHENKLVSSAYNNMYYNLFSSCESLDEIIGLPVHYRDNGITSNFFSSTFNACGRLKNMTFAVQEDGTPYVAKWKSQVIDLSNYVGYPYGNASNMYGSIIKYNSGITLDKCVWTAEDYQELKNDPDWFTHYNNPEYSRYNHDSAVATLNSLPDTSAYGTNTIKFKGICGSSTDGGAINTLTESEIAVAAAKGWTVTLT